MKDTLKGWVLIIGGVTLFGTAAWLAVDSAMFLGGADRALGEVVAVERRRSPRGLPLFHPVVRYQPAATDAPAASPVEFTARPGLWPAPWEPGDRVEVAYRPGHPEAARIVSFWMLWFMPLATAVFGLCCVFAGWHTYQSGRHR